MNKLSELKNILSASGLKQFNPEDYDFSLPDGLDEKGANGIWDMAGDIAFELCPTGYTDCDGRNLDAEADSLQTLLYNLFLFFKTENKGVKKGETTQKNLYSIEQMDDPYCASFTDYVCLTKEVAMALAKICPDVKRIAKWEYDESLQCYKKSYDNETSIFPESWKNTTKE